MVNRAGPRTGWLAALMVLAPAMVFAAEPVEYARDVKPIFARHCAACHGALQAEGGLRLDVPQHWRRGGDSGAVVMPGEPNTSLLWKAVTGADGVSRMPAEGKPLSNEDLDVLQRWIAEGAVAADEPEPPDPRRHWAFVPPARLPPPVVPGATAAHGIDAWIAKSHADRQILPVGEADKATLLRRVTWDLTGAPPTDDELAAFLADDSPHGYEQVVDRLLASPRYGERWARHWMDVWRYSDWYGYREELRNSQRHLWRWRDWIVESLNADKPYDRMIVEMLAADELDPLNDDALRATGFLVRNYYKFNRDVWLDNTVEHTGKAFLGLTLNCARCHHHKYDPIVQRQYYEFRAIFEPYDVRIDRLPGTPDLNKDGLARVYDKYLDAQTYLYERGNDKYPRKDAPLSPAVPEFLLGRGLEIESVVLPATSRFPGLKDYIQQEALAAAALALQQAQTAAETAEAELAQARQQLQPFVDSPADATSPEGAAPAARSADLAFRTAEAAARLARSRVVEAEQSLVALRASIAADAARFAEPPRGDVQPLIDAAQAAHRSHQLSKADVELAQAELDLVRAEQPVKEGTKGAKPREELLKAVAAANDKRKQAGAANGSYASLSDVYPERSTGRRLALANWIVDRRNPLTARVAVNHVWQRHFGEPLAPSMFDFGRAAQSPALPELLDWLAVEFMDSGWSLKHLHRLMTTSAAYRRSSSTRAAASDTLHRDPDNRYWWRMTPRRLEAEAVRDGLLFVSHAVDDRLGGADLDAKDGLQTYRRSLYYRHAPEKSMEFLSLFDGPSANECYRRDVTVAPQQALALHNSSLSVELAERTAAALTKAVGPTADNDAGFVTAAFRRVLSRNPTADELRKCVDYLNATDATLRLQRRSQLIHVLFNHNDFVSVR